MLTHCGLQGLAVYCNHQPTIWLLLCLVWRYWLRLPAMLVKLFWSENFPKFWLSAWLTNTTLSGLTVAICHDQVGGRTHCKMSPESPISKQWAKSVPEILIFDLLKTHLWVKMLSYRGINVFSYVCVHMYICLYMYVVYLYVNISVCVYIII